jgi:hypothetical protein
MFKKCYNIPPSYHALDEEHLLKEARDVNMVSVMNK